MARTLAPAHDTLSVTAAASMGVAALVKKAETGTEVVVERRHQPVAVMISIERLDALRESQRDLRDIGLVLARAATDNGERFELEDVIAKLGYNLASLEAELDEDLVTGRE
jgi:prevent-host-death family protein